MNIGKGSLQTRLPSNKYRVGYDMIKWNSDNGHTPASGVMGDTMSGSSREIASELCASAIRAINASCRGGSNECIAYSVSGDFPPSWNGDIVHPYEDDRL